ncbi:MAG: hypothetical protein C0499_08170 [Zymomonas sp.]|nr:hypothetical protein [Zymomonas sp.]
MSAWTAAALAAAPLAVVAVGAAITAATTTAVPVGAAVEAGPDQTITLPTNQVTLNGRINGVTARWVTRRGGAIDHRVSDIARHDGDLCQGGHV